MSGYACASWVATAGQQGPALGSDEQPLVLLTFVIIEIAPNKIVGVQQYVVRPPEDEDALVAPVAVGGPPSGLLSQDILEASALSDDLVRRIGQPLPLVLSQFDAYVRSLQIDPESPNFRLITDGQLPFRQCLHPQACARSIPLPSYFCRFHDLHKEFLKAYSCNLDILTIHQILQYLAIPGYEGNDFYMKESKDMANIIKRMISDGHQFELLETINLVLEPGICSKDDEIDGNCIVRARGLPWQSSDQDIAKFFRGLNLTKGGVALCLSPQGRRNGEALVRFISQEHRDMALKRHKHHIGNRYIEVYRATGEDFLGVAGGATNEAAAFLSRGAQVIVRMRGLPYDCTPAQVLDFFSSGINPCSVLDGAEGVLFVKRADGRATGDAFVLFAKEEDAPKALAKHRELIGSRYIELFRSTTAEVQQVLNRSLDPKTYESTTATSGPILGPLPPVALLPQHMITSGTLKDCIRLRGLPYEAQVEHILKFLDDFSKNIVYQGVHMVYNAQGQPSGEAFIQMDSETSAFLSAQQKHHRYMTFGKKQRYIEVFQCSGEDMNLVLTGGMASPSAGGKALSPGRCSSPQRAPPSIPSPVPQNPAPLAPMAPVPNQAAAAAAAALSAAQQQAQMIAQHALLMRQGAEQRDLLLQQVMPQMHYLPQPLPHLAAFNLNHLNLGHMKQFAVQQPLYVPFPRLLAPPPSRAQLALPPPSLPPPAPASSPSYHLAHLMSPLHHAMKRSYEHAFAPTPADVAAKRHFAGYAPTIPTSSLAHMPPPSAAYPHFYPGI